MQILRRGTRRSLLLVTEKMASVLVIIALLLQPVGMAGVYGAFSFSQGVALASEEIDEEKVDQDKKDEEEAKEEVESDSSEEELEASAEETEEKEETPEVVSDAVEDATPIVEEVIGENLVVEEVVIPEAEEESNKEEDLSSNEAEIEEETEENQEEKEESAPATEEEEVKEEDDEEDVWKENEGGVFETVDPVVLGETYVAPQDEEVTITFTKLPAEPKSVKIEKVKLSAKEKAALGALADTAYDITSSMEDGTFAYKLTLPIPQGKTGVEVKFLEDLDDLESAEVISQDDTKTKDEVVEVKLDHFTLFIATYSDPIFSVLEDEYTPGETVYTKAVDLDPNKFYRININPPTGSAFRISEPSCFNPTPETTILEASYALPVDAAISDNWSADLKEYTNAGCTGVSTLAANFKVVGEETDEEHVEVTFCHATPPDTAENGYNKQTTDDDAIFTTGHASEHDADIIPPFSAGEVNFPGKNWDALGQAIWNNECGAVGELQLIKLLDDGSDVTLWQFQLDEEDPRNSDVNGLVDFGFVPTGEHVITEIGMTNYSLVGVSGTNCAWDEETLSVIATVESGETTVCTLNNAVDKGSITILKAVEGDDVQDFTFSTTNLDAQTFVLDDDGNSGNEYSNSRTFGGLLPGVYSVTEESVTGWALENLVCTSSLVSLAVPVAATVNLELHPGESITCTYTNKKQVSEEEDDPFCGDGILNQESEQCDGTAGITEGENFCTFSCQLVPLYQGGGVCSEGTEPVLVDTKFVESFMTDGIIPDPVKVALTGGKEYIVESVGYFGYGGVPHNNTLNRADAGYATDTNWAGANLDTLFGSAATALYRGIHMLISDFGTGTFGVVNWGDYNPSHTYTKNFITVTDTEVQFAISDWYDTWYAGDELSNFNKNQFGFRDNDGGLTLNIYECQGSEQESPRLLLTKTNDSVSDETPGNEVVYSLTVTALGGDVNDVALTDLPPEGFEYVDGSGEGAPFIHEYASPGIWDLGDMEEGESKTVTYKTRISDSQDAGLYKDLAFARGMSGAGNTVFANGEADPFVGTDVNVVLNTDPTVMLDEETEKEKKRKTKTVTQYVLGATLPLTGTKAGWFGVAALLIGGGLGLVLASRRRKGTMIGLMFLGVVSFGMPAVAEGATLSARIETPEATMTTQDFKIGFTTLDVLGRNLEVECYKAGNATPFAEYVLESSFGGNSGDCEVNSLVVPTDGNYEFFIRVNAMGESPETVESEHVMVTVASERPGTPFNYDRDDDDCQVIIAFTTANDGGKTSKVELYRSTDNPFVANSSTKVNEQVIGSSTNGSFAEALPGCDDDVFYAIRAVATNGNGSGFVGDVDVDTETTTSTRTRVNTVTVPGAGGSALPVGTGEGAESGVQGATTETPETTGDEAGDDGETGGVLGEMTEEKEAPEENQIVQSLKNHPWLVAFGLIVVLFLVRYGYRRYATRSQSEL